MDKTLFLFPTCQSSGAPGSGGHGESSGQEAGREATGRAESGWEPRVRPRKQRGAE